MDPPLLALAWRTVFAAARTTGRSILGQNDADLDDVATAAALRALARADLPLTPKAVLRGAVLDRVAIMTAQRLARDLVRARHGRRRNVTRRVDPLRRADTVALLDAVTGYPAALRVPSAEDVLLAREHERQMQAVWAAAQRLPRAQKEAIAARLAGRRPLSPAMRQALRAALMALRGSVAASGLQSGSGSARA
ncbi:hypothetical protein [Roseomonas chloroacetimidivorans]|uniref:hypothetical protein n=1 Tax=Roseomonas chloroacetimidivorans TaxID=1766656 RepID=UPI003C70D95E